MTDSAPATEPTEAQLKAARELAIKIVDGTLGYTCAHNASPSHHRQLYDIAEQHIARALADEAARVRAECEADYASLREQVEDQESELCGWTDRTAALEAHAIRAEAEVARLSAVTDEMVTAAYRVITTSNDPRGLHFVLRRALTAALAARSTMGGER